MVDDSRQAGVDEIEITEAMERVGLDALERLGYEPARSGGYQPSSSDVVRAVYIAMRAADPQQAGFYSQTEILAEERGEDIAAEIIAKAIREKIATFPPADDAPGCSCKPGKISPVCPIHDTAF